MAETIITNIAEVAGTRAGEAITFESNPVSVTLIDGLSAVKSASKTHWVNGSLDYTIVVTNNSGADFSIGTFTDKFDPLTELDGTVEVKVNGEQAAYYYADNEISIILPAIDDGAAATITFAVKRV